MAGASAFHFFDIVGLRTAQFPERLQERRVAELVFCIVCSARHKQADAPHAVTLLRAHRERPRGRHAAKKGDELATFSLPDAFPCFRPKG